MDIGPYGAVGRRNCGPMRLLDRGKEASTVSEPSSTDDGTPVCLHCEINELVRERVEQAGADLADLALMIVESLAELILLAPNGEQSKLMADVLAHFGH